MYSMSFIQFIVIHFSKLRMTVFSLYSTRKSLYESVPSDRCIIDMSKKQYLYAADPGKE